MRLRVVCFDLGGVIVRICRSFAEACERAGLPFRDPDFMTSEGALDERRALIHAYQKGALGSEEYFAQMAHTTRGRYTPAEVLSIHDAWLVEEYPGVPELVARLNASGTVTTACLSNTNDRHWSALAGPGFPSVLEIERRFASHLVRASKPAPDIYEHAARELAASGDEILFFDDLDGNVEAARSLGWRAERVDPDGSPAEQMARHLRQHGVLS